MIELWRFIMDNFGPEIIIKVYDPKSGMRGFLECLEESRKIARLEPIKTGAHPLPWHTDNAKIGRVYVGDQFGA